MKVTFTAGTIPAQPEILVPLFERDRDNFAAIMKEIESDGDPVGPIHDPGGVRHLLTTPGFPEKAKEAIQKWLEGEHSIYVPGTVDNHYELQECILEKLGDVTGVDPDEAGWDASDIEVVAIDYGFLILPGFINTHWSDELPDGFQALLSACDTYSSDVIQEFSDNQHHFWDDMTELVSDFEEAYIGQLTPEEYYRSIQDIPAWLSPWVDWDGMLEADGDVWQYGRHLFRNI